MFPKLLRGALIFALVMTCGCNEPTDSGINAAYFMGRLIAGETCKLKVICRANTTGKPVKQIHADLSPMGGPSVQPLTLNPDGTWRAIIDVMPEEKGLNTILLTAVDNESLQTVHKTTARVHVPGKAIAVAAGEWHNLALKSDGTVVCWGGNLHNVSYGVCDVPAGLSDVVAVAAGNTYSFALKFDGTVTCWGGAGGGVYLCSDTQKMSDIAVITGESVALKADGTVIDPDCWYFEDCDIVENLHNIIDLKTGFGQRLAIQSDRTVACWGKKNDGECDVPAGLNDVTAVAGGYLHSLALKGDGSVVAWGGDGPDKFNSIVPPGLGKLTAIDTRGNEYSFINIGLRQDGTVVWWSKARYGAQFTVHRSHYNSIAVAAGWYHLLALRKDGSIQAWGDNQYGQCDVPEELQ